MIRNVMLAALLFALPQPGLADDDTLLLQSTTSTANSGLYDHLLPIFKAETGITVNVVAVGTGQAIRNAENCDADVLLVHARAAEEAFVAAGYGVARHDVMFNDFVIVGPADDPAGISGMEDATAALSRIAETGARFASRGDDSGTHKAEQRLWADSGTDPAPFSGKWYLETGSGMGATLNTAAGIGAYALTDRATWVSFANKSDLKIHVEGDEQLFNQYGVVRVNPAHCPGVNTTAAEAFVAWVTGEKGQAAIAEYAVDGEQLFFANAN